MADVQAADQGRGNVFQTSAMAPNTRAGYDGDWRAFQRWCTTRELTALPAQSGTVADYLATCAQLVSPGGEWVYSPVTLGRWVAAINAVHRLAGYLPPGAHTSVTTTLAGIRREHQRPVRRMSPMLLDDLRAALSLIELRRWPAAVIGRRDAFALLAGFAGAFRRSELAALQWGGVIAHPQDGLHVRVRSSKTDQFGRGAIKPLPYGASPATCPVCAFARWAAVVSAWESRGRVGVLAVLAAPDRSGKHVCGALVDLPPDLDSAVLSPVSRHGTVGAGPVTGHAINLVVKRRLAAAGLNPAHYGGHSMRAGFVTQAFREGADAHSIMRQTGHRSPAMVEVYARENLPLAGNAVARLGL